MAGNNEFARQLAARRAAAQQQLPAKKFRSSAAPKGTKLATGYVDRAKERSETEVEDERASRLEALQALYKDGQIEHEDYVHQTKLLGGDVSSTHLVRGLDFALLERVRKGEDVMGADGKTAEEQGEEAEAANEALEDKLDEVLQKDVAPVERKKEKKRGVVAPRSRAEILAELKRSRQAAREAANPALGSKFRKIGEKKEEKKAAQEEEVKVKHVMGADGKVKKKVKRSEKDRRDKLDMPPPSSKVMGMMPPPPLPGAKPAEPEEDEGEVNIFDDVEDYDPLAGLHGDSSDEDEPKDKEKGKEKENAEDKKGEPKKNEDPEAKNPETKDLETKDPEAKLLEAKEETEDPESMDLDLDSDTDTAPAPARAPASTSTPSETTPTTTTTTMPPPPRPKPKIFASVSSEDDDTYRPPSSASSLLASDPGLAAALAKAAKIGSKQDDEKEKKRKAIQEASDRDAYDIDFGFGGSRDFGDDDDDMVGGGSGGAKKRKRGPKKKKGDKNDPTTVERIVQERYGKKEG